jgi:hypothetical protein
MNSFCEIKITESIPAPNNLAAAASKQASNLEAAAASKHIYSSSSLAST